MVRQPYVGSFRSGNFTFKLMTAHTFPSVNLQELEGLGLQYETEKAKEDDIIILGDLNADCDYLDEAEDIYLRYDAFTWVVENSEDTTVSGTDCAYDRFIFDSETVPDFTGNYGIYKNITDDISDHYLIWAEFGTD